MTDCQMEYMTLLPKFKGEAWFEEQGWEDPNIVSLRNRISSLELEMTAEEIINCIRKINNNE